MKFFCGGEYTHVVISRRSVAPAALGLGLWGRRSCSRGHALARCSGLFLSLALRCGPPNVGLLPPDRLRRILLVRSSCGLARGRRCIRVPCFPIPPVLGIPAPLLLILLEPLRRGNHDRVRQALARWGEDERRVSLPRNKGHSIGEAVHKGEDEGSQVFGVARLEIGAEHVAGYEDRGEGARGLCVRRRSRVAA